MKWATYLSLMQITSLPLVDIDTDGNQLLGFVALHMAKIVGVYIVYMPRITP